MNKNISDNEAKKNLILKPLSIQRKQNFNELDKSEPTYVDEKMMKKEVDLTDRQSMNYRMTHSNSTSSESPQETTDQQRTKEKSTVKRERAFSLDEVKSELKNILKNLLLIKEEIEEEEKFDTYGMDSILNVEFINKVNTHFSLQLTAADLYDFSSAKKLAMHVANLLTPQGEPS